MRAKAALLGLLSVVLLAPAGAQALPAACPSPYPDPRLSLNFHHDVVQRGAPHKLGGYLTRNGCGLAGERIGLFVREKPGRFFWVATTTTNAQGAYQFERRAPRSYDVLAIFSRTAEHATALSRIIHMSVTAGPPDNPGGYLGGCLTTRMNPAYQPAAGRTLTLDLAANSVQRGRDLAGTITIHNDTNNEFEIDLYENGEQEAFLRNTRTGELPGWNFFSDAIGIRTIAIGAHASHNIPVTLHTTFCQIFRSTFAVHPDSYEVVGGIWMSEGDVGQSAHWYTPPVPVTLTG